jgi:hypothetical protein
MPTSLVTNFDINLNQPIDSRIVVTNSSSRDAINYKYDGLTVFQTDTRQSWTWNNSSATWSYNVAGNGIYGGSGSLIGNTFINIDTVGSSVGNTSKILGYYLVAGSNTVYLNNYLRRTAADPTFQSLAFRLQLLADSTPSSYIEFNPSYTDYGALAFGTNNLERLRINANGKTGILMTAYGQSSFMVNGIASSEGIYISPDNSNIAGVGGGYAILVDTSGNLRIRDTSPNSPDFVNSLNPGYQVINIVGGRMLIGGTSSTAATVTTPDSRLDIFETTALGTTTGNSLILKTLTHNQAGNSSGNTIRVREWALRDKTFSSLNGWESWRYHNGISIDGSFGTPTISKTFWERDPLSGKQWFGSDGLKAVEIEAASNLSTITLRNTNLNKTFKINNDKTITYISSNSYIIEGTGRNINSSGTIINFIGIPNSSQVIVEAEFNSIGSYNVSLSTSYVSRQNMVRDIYNISNIGVVTNITSNSIYDSSANSTGGGRTISPGIIITATGIIALSQDYTGTGNFICNVSYKLYIINIPSAPFATGGAFPPSSTGVSGIDIGGLV